MSGIHNPWTKPPSAQQQANEKVDAVIAGDPHRKPPRRSIVFEGRSFQIAADFYTYELDPKHLTLYAADALGRAISEARLKAPQAINSNFARQSIVYDEAKATWPKVTWGLGELKLFVRASSHDAGLAFMMAVDRVALALMDAMMEAPALRTLFKDMGVALTRKA